MTSSLDPPPAAPHLPHHASPFLHLLLLFLLHHHATSEALPFFLWHFYFSHSSSLFILHLLLPLLLSLHLFSYFDPGQTEAARMQVVLLL